MAMLGDDIMPARTSLTNTQAALLCTSEIRSADCTDAVLRHPGTRIRPLCAAIALALMFAPTTGSVNAANRTWDGTGTTNNWSNGGNWNGNTDIANNDSLIFAGSTRLNAVNNLPNSDNPLGGISVLSVSKLTFAAGSVASPTGQFILSGNPLISKGDIINASGVLQTLSMPINQVGVGNIWDGGTGGMKFNGLLTIGDVGAFSNNAIANLTLKNGVTIDNNRYEDTFVVGMWGTHSLTIESASKLSTNAALIGLTNETITVTLAGGRTTWETCEIWYGVCFSGSSGSYPNTSGTIIYTLTGSSDGTVTVRDAGSRWDTLDLRVGLAAKGRLNIANGGTVTSGSTVVGMTEVADGAISITGANSILYSGNFFDIGMAGKGSLSILSGGGVVSYISRIGSQSGGNGIVDVIGANSSWHNSGSLAIGDVGTGKLQITGGARVTSDQGRIGVSSSGVGTVIVSGLGSKWTAGSSLSVGESGAGVLNILDGATVEAGALSIGSRGSINFSGGTLDVIGAARSAGAQFNWTGGTLRIMSAFTLGSGILDGVATLSAGKTLEAGTSFAVGAGNQLYLAGGTLGGAGSLVNDAFLSGFGTIAGSGGFTNGALLSQSGGNLVLSNTGPNANNGNWDLSPGFQLQLAGVTLTNNASLNLNSGNVTGTGTLINATGGSIFGRGVIDSGFSNAGVIALDAGTTSITRAFSNSGQIQLASNTALLTGGVVTNSGRIEGFGKVNNAVNNSGMVEAIGGTLTMAGSLINASGGIIAAGSGAKVLVSSGLASNAGQIQLSGGTFDNNGRALANTSTGVVSGFGTLRSGPIANDGGVLLSGGTSAVYAGVTANAGSQIVLSGNSNTTFYGTVEVKDGAELRVSQGSVATFFGQVNQRNGANFTGSGAKNYEAGFAVGNSPGLGTDPGNVTFGSANVYEAEIGGTNPGVPQLADLQFDRYVVNGTLTFGGTLKVVQYGGFAPQAGNSFDLFDWGTRQGQFAALDFSAAPLAGGLAWDTSRLYVDGTLSVAAVPEPGTYAMFAAGLGLMGFMVRRRQRHQAA